MINFSRHWAMPSSETFSIKPIKEFVERYADKCRVSIDPFARNCRMAHYTNDINPNTKAMYHMDAIGFLEFMGKNRIRPDLIILDMPYSARQISECYKEIGIKVTQQHTQIGSFYQAVRDAANEMIAYDGTVLSFGWNTVGMGIKRGYKIEEIMMVCHGGPHNDTICMAEKKQKLDNQQSI